MGYSEAYKNAKQLLERIHTGQAREESRIKVASRHEEFKRGLVRKRESVQAEPQQNSPLDFLPNYMNLASVRAEEGPEEPAKKSSGTQLASPVKGPVGAALEALAAVESRGSGDYAAVGPVVTKGQYKGQRAYGRYQVMEGNIGPWSKEVMGRPYTKEEWMANKDGVQDKVTASRLAASYHKHGTWEDAASVWFTGQPLSKGGNRSDGNLTGNQYVAKFQKHFKMPEGSTATPAAPIFSERPQTRGFLSRKGK